MVIQKQVTFWFLAVLMAGAAYLCYLIGQPFLEPALTAVLIATVMFPMHGRIERRLGHRRGRAALVSVFVVAMLLLIPAVLLGVTLTREANALIQKLNQGGHGPGDLTGTAMSYVDAAVAWAGQFVDVSQFNARAKIAELVQKASGAVLRSAGSILGGVGSLLGNLVIAFFVLFFLFRDGSEMLDSITSLLPLEKEQIDALVLSVSDAIVASVYGALSVSIGQGLLTGVGFWIAGVGSPVLWGSVACFASLIPIVGAAIVWVPGALVLLAGGHWGMASFLAIWGIGVVGMVDNILRPYVLSGRVQLHPLLLVVALLGGVQAFGMIGLVAGPVVLAVTQALVAMLKSELRVWTAKAKAKAAS